MNSARTVMLLMLFTHRCSDDTLEGATTLGATNAGAAVQSNSADTPRHAGHNPFLEVGPCPLGPYDHQVKCAIFRVIDYHKQ